MGISFATGSGPNRPLNTLEDIQNVIGSEGSERAGAIIRDAACGGNLLCQVFLSQAGLFVPVEKRTEHIKHEIELFTKLAAEGGDSGSQFNLAKFYIDQFPANAEFVSQEDMELIRKAKYWNRKAAENGFEPSIQMLKTLECFPD